MFSAFVISILLLKLVSSCSTFESKDVCKQGWFGSSCQYRCRCESYQCTDNGTCQHGYNCQGGWFGPECQFMDLAFNSNKPVLGGKDNTCTTRQSTFITVPLNKTFDSYHISWMRIHINNFWTEHFVQSLNITFKGNKIFNCINARNSTVDKNTLDVHCDLPETVYSVTLEGPAIPYLCSVYVSGGRNLALGQSTNQSTNYKTIGFSSCAVDGDTSSDFEEGKSCTHTDEGDIDKDPTWSLSLATPGLVTRFLIYNRNNNQERLRHFLLETFDSTNMKVFSYKDKSNQSQRVFQILSSNVTSPVSSLVIKIPKSNLKDNILTLCEVEMFGDSSCQGGKYGRECEFECNCQDHSDCFVSTGGCPAGCANGYQGKTCSEACDIEKYGQDCNVSCSDFCVQTNQSEVSSCNHVDGSCLYGCKPGYLEPNCDIKQAQAGDDSNSTTTIVVILLLVLIIAVVIVALFVVYRRRNAFQKRSEIQMNELDHENVYDQVMDKHMSYLQPDNIHLRTPPSTKKINISRSAKKNYGTSKSPDEKENANIYNNTVADDQTSTTALSLQDFDTFLLSKDRAFFQEQFNALNENQTATSKVGQNSENRCKNRYKNIPAYDHSRVCLIANFDKKHGDYINACYVEGYNSEERFIAAQGPTEAILDDFIRMLWEQEVTKVVMLTNLVEDGKQKCARYWPEEGEMKKGEITVKLTTTQVFADYTIRRLQLRKENAPVQNVSHFHFTSWPDKNIPTAPWGLVEFEQRVAMYPSSKPIVVHCSAGVGRTGTFIALRNVMRQAEETGEMDFFQAVKTLRRDRINMVQTVDQYIFLHRAAQVAMLCIGTSVSLKEASQRIKTLETRTDSGHTRLELEFKAVCSVTDQTVEETSARESSSGTYENSQNLLNRQRNRDITVLPKENYRPVLTCEEKSFSNYINAVLLPSFNKPNHQILTQLPLPTTVTDFWRLVTQYQVSLVVSFELDTKTIDQTVVDYLPSEGSSTSLFSMFSIRKETDVASTLWKQGKVIVNSDKSKKEHHVTHLTCTTNDMEPRHYLAIAEHVRSLYSSSKGRTLYMCRNGAEYSGLVCVLSLLLDRMDNDHKLTVPLVVGAIKAIRPQVIPTLVQYRLLYEVLELYSDSMNDYSNLGD